MRSIKPLVIAAALGFGAFAAAPGTAQTLKTVQDRGALICGVSQGLEGFSIKDDKGGWSGFDVDFCRALAAAIFNDPSKVQYVPLTASERFDALKNKQIDVLSRNSTWTMGRESEFGVVFAGRHLLRRTGVSRSQEPQASPSALELDGSKVCIQNGTTSEPNAMDFFETNHINYRDRPRRHGRRHRVRLSVRQMRRADDRRITALLPALPVSQARRSHDPARRHLEGAAGTGRPAGRHAMVQHRKMGEFRPARRGGARRRLEDRRRRHEVAKALGQTAGRDGGRVRQAARPHGRLGGERRSGPWAIMARSSTATSAPTRSSASRAV